jgi:adenylate cyclase
VRSASRLSSRDQVGNKLPAGFDDLGDQQVKNIAQPIRVYRVQLQKPRQTGRCIAALPDKPSIAVLPFQNMSGDPSRNILPMAWSRRSSPRLSHSLAVRDRPQFELHLQGPRGRREAGRARSLGVRYVLEGSVRKGGNRCGSPRS